MKTDCGREADVLEALTGSRWPSACSAELRGHIAECTSCADLVDVVLALSGDHYDTTHAAPIPSSAIVWWRAQMRARQEAAQAASRPISVVQSVALAAAIALLVATAGTTLAFFRGSLPPIERMVEVLKSFAPSAPTESLLTPQGIAIAALLAIWTIGAPLAVYLAVSDE